MERLQTNIDSQIARGVQLRKAKTRGSVLNKPLQVAGLNEHDGTPKRRFNGRYNLSETNPCCSLTPSSPLTKTVSPTRTYSPASKTNFSRPHTPNSMIKPKNVGGCSLRIAELAEPSKRHCIETWKSSRYTLPGFMLDRLRNTIMNKKIGAQVPDAINSFRSNAKTPSSQRERKKLCGKCLDYAKRREAEEKMYIRNMCALFAHCMAKRLIKPLNVTLTAELDKLSDLIAEEMMILLKNRSELVPDFLQNANILKEMSGKVALWIAQILNDVYYKMLEDDLRAKKHHENKLGKSDELVTSIETYNRKQLDRGDLEEEEGPALDALDQLIDNVVHRCVKISDSEADDDNISSQIETEPAESSYCTDNSNIDVHDTENVVESDQGYSQENETEVFDPNNDVISKIMQSEPAVYNITQQNIDDTNATSITSSDENDQSLGSFNDESVNIDGPEIDIKSLLNSLLKEAHLNVSEVFVLPSEESQNEKKAVTFTDVVLGSETKQSIESRKSKSDIPIVQKKSDIVLAPPNDHLLSFADELWPEDYFNPTIKAIAKVSKSVTSLGKIFETAETNDEAGVESITIRLHKSDTIETEPNISKVNNEKIKIGANNQWVDNEPKINNEHSSQNEIDEPRIDMNITAKGLDDAVLLNTRDFSTNHNSGETIKYLNKNMETEGIQGKANVLGSAKHEKYSNLNKHDEVKAKSEDSATGDQTDRVSENDPILKAAKQNLKPNSKTSFDYNVSLQTAPSWVKQSISEESLNNSSLAKKHHISQCDLRKWCRDLEHILINLEQWNQWIDVVCRKIMLMKQQAKGTDDFAPLDKEQELKAWSKLKKSIDKDALLWRKLCERTQIVLRNNNIKAIVDKSKNFKRDGLQDKLHSNKKSLRDTIEAYDKILPTDYSVKCKCRVDMKRNTCSKVKKY